MLLNRLLKLICGIILIGVSTFSSMAQTDSVLPDYEAEYILYRMTFDSNMDWVYEQNSVYITDYDLDDSLEVQLFLNWPPSAKIITDSNKAYIVGIQDQGGYLRVYPDSAIVLYDFSLQVGDTAYMDYNGGFTQPAIVESVDYLFIDGEQRKRLMLSNMDEWIQGIGSLTHPLWPVMNHFEVNYIFCQMSATFLDFYYYAYEYQDCSGYSSIGLNEPVLPEKQLLRTVDLLGREVNSSTNQLMIRIFSDGSTEKTYVHD